MPGFNRTGPLGMGPMTGGGRGLCNPGGRGVGYRPYGLGRGLRRGFGRGLGLGFGNAYRAGYPYSAPTAPQMTREQELDFLKSQSQDIKDQLGEIEARIQQINDEA